MYPLKLIPPKIKVDFFKLEKSLLIISTILVFFSFFSLWRIISFWDLDVYQNAVNVFNSGGSAYLDLDGLKFVYAPYILILFSLLGTNLSLSLFIFYLSSSLSILSQRLGAQLIVYSVISNPLQWYVSNK